MADNNNLIVYCEYEDGKDFESETEFYYRKTLKVPPRTVIVLVAETGI